jgi:ABC-type glycerol-3-phosphate transport system permease component
MRHLIRRRWRLALMYALVTGFAILFLLPIAWILVTALKPSLEIYTRDVHFLPHSPTLSNFEDVVASLPQFPGYLENSFIVAIMSVIGVTVVSALAGYPLARLGFRGKRLVLGLILLVVAVPYALYLIPLYLLESNTGLLNSIPGLVLPYIALNLPLAVILMRGTYRSIPREIEEAARVDGATSLRAWWSVLLPLAGPGVASVVVLTFIAVWGEFMFAVTLFSSGGNTTFPVGITFLQQEGAAYSFGPLSATIVISLIPALVIFLLLQRYFVRGILEGGIKQ